MSSGGVSLSIVQWPGPSNHTESQQALDSFPAAPLRIRVVFSGTDIEVELRWTVP